MKVNQMLWTAFLVLIGCFIGWLTPMPNWAAKVWARVLGVKTVILSKTGSSDPRL